MRVIVSVLNVAVMHMRVLMGLSVVAVLVRMLNMLMIMPQMRVSVRLVPVRVLMSMWCGHSCPVSDSSQFGEHPQQYELIRASSPMLQTTSRGAWRHINAGSWQQLKRSAHFSRPIQDRR